MNELGTAGQYGNYLCDAPHITSQAALAYMVKVNPNPDFIIWTGYRIIYQTTTIHYQIYLSFSSNPVILLFLLIVCIYVNISLSSSRDSPPHYLDFSSVEPYTRQMVLTSIQTMTDMITQAFPNTTVYPSLGTINTLSGIYQYFILIDSTSYIIQAIMIIGWLINWPLLHWESTGYLR